MALQAKYTAQMAFLGTPETAAKVIELSDLRGVSKAQIIRELVEGHIDAALAEAHGEAEPVVEEAPVKRTRVRSSTASKKAS